MGDINPRHYLDELRDNRKNEDLIKARFLIDQLPRLEPDFQARVFCEIVADPSRYGSVLLGYLASRATGCAIPRQELKNALAGRITLDPELREIFMSGEDFRDKGLFEEIVVDI